MTINIIYGCSNILPTRKYVRGRVSALEHYICIHSDTAYCLLTFSNFHTMNFQNVQHIKTVNDEITIPQIKNSPVIDREHSMICRLQNSHLLNHDLYIDTSVNFTTFQFFESVKFQEKIQLGKTPADNTTRRMTSVDSLDRLDYAVISDVIDLIRFASACR